MPNRRDPKTGRVISKFESLAQDNALAAAQFGQNEVEQAVTEIEFNLKGDSDAVRSYIDRLLELVRENLGSAADLQRILPLIQETVTLTKEDPSLTKAERNRIARIADALTAQIRRKTALFARIRSTLRNVTRDKTNAARDKVSDVLQGSDSAIGKLAGKVLQRREQEQSMLAKAILSARGDLFQTVADRRAGRTSLPSISEPEIESGGFGGESDKLLRNILDEVVDIRDILRQESERGRLNDEQAERDKNNVHGAPGSKVTSGAVKKDTGQSFLQTAASYLGGLLTKLGGLMGAFGTTVRGLFGTVLSGLRSATGLIGNLFSRISLLARSAVTGAFEYIQTAASRVLGLLPDAVALMSPVAVAAAQLWVTNKLAGVFNELQQKYPFLNRPQSVKEDVRGVVDAKKNIQTVLQNTQQGKTIQPVGGVESPASFNVRHQLGMSPDEYRALPEPDRKSREDNWRLNHPGMDTSRKAADTNLPNDTHPIVATPPLVSITPLSGLPGQETNLVPPTLQAPTKKTKDQKDTAPSKSDQHLSEAGLQALKKREGLPQGQQEGGPYTAYFDKVGKVWTIGHGLTGAINGHPIAEGMVISAADEDAEIRRRVRTVAEPDIKRGLKGMAVPQSTFDALVSVSYNTGPKKAGYNLARKVAQGQTLTSADFLASATAKNGAGESVRVHGLENRRLSEYRQATFTAAPSSSRSAAPLVAAAAEGRSGGVTIVAPQVVTTSARNNAPSTTYVPMPITAENADETLRALRSVGGI